MQADLAALKNQLGAVHRELQEIKTLLRKSAGGSPAEFPSIVAVPK